MSKVYSMVAGGFIGWGTSAGLFFGEYLAMGVYYFVAVGILYLSYVEYCNQQALVELNAQFKRAHTETRANLNQMLQSSLDLHEQHLQLQEKPIERNACFRYPEQDPSCRLN